MGPFALTVLSGILGNIGSDAVRSRVRGLVSRSGVVAPSDRRVVPQIGPPRVELSAPVTYGPPVPLAASARLSGPALASLLAQRRAFR